MAKSAPQLLVKSGTLLVAIFFVFVMAAKAQVLTGQLTLTNCGTAMTSCPGATYNFNVGDTSATLSITIGGGNALTSTNDQITGVDLGFLPQKDISTFSSTVDTNFNGTAGTWTGVLGSLSNSNCGGNMGAFVCADGSPALLVNGDTYTWTWNYTLTSAGISDLPSDTTVHVGANYGPANGLIVSETPSASLTPEPATIGLFGAGLVYLGAILRRRRKATTACPVA